MSENHDHNAKHIKHRVITQLDRDELEFLDKLGKDAMFASGHKLSHNEILEVLVIMAREMDISWESINNIKSLLEEKDHDKKERTDKRGSIA